MQSLSSLWAMEADAIGLDMDGPTAQPDHRFALPDAVDADMGLSLPVLSPCLTSEHSWSQLETGDTQLALSPLASSSATVAMERDLLLPVSPPPAVVVHSFVPVEPSHAVDSQEPTTIVPVVAAAVPSPAVPAVTVAPAATCHMAALPLVVLALTHGSAPAWTAVGHSAASTTTKKAKHRAIDARRRNLEAEAMQTLQQLVMEPHMSHAAGAAAGAGAGAAAAVAAAAHNAGTAELVVAPAVPSAPPAPVPKVSLLQACAEYIRGLQDQVQRLQASISTSDSSCTASSSSERKRKRAHPQAVLDEIGRLEESRVLRNEMFVSAAVLLCCMDLTGRWIDVNERWLQRMCWSREDVLGRFGSPMAAYMPFITQHPDAQMRFPPNELVPIQDSCSRHFEYVQHDATTISHLRSLYQQQQQVIEFVDGFVMGCGKFIEIRWTCWLVMHEDRPRYFCLSAPDSAIVHITCTYQQAKQLASAPKARVDATAAAAARGGPVTKPMEHHDLSIPSCTCTPARCVPSCTHCTSDCHSCSTSSCRSARSPSSPPSPVDSMPSSNACNCCRQCSCNTTVPCGCAL